MKKFLFFSFAILLALSFFWRFPVLPASFSKGAVLFASPFWSAQKYLEDKFTPIRSFFIFKKNLLEENTRLREEVVSLTLKSYVYDILVRENQTLKEALGRNTKEANAVFAVVLSKPNKSPYDTLLLDVGETHGVRTGDIVRVYDDVPIGRVLEVYGASSKVILFSSPGEEIDIEIGKENISTRAKGVGGGNFKAVVPRGLDVKEGDSIVFPSVSARFIGVVEKIKVKPSDSLQTIFFKSPVNIFQLKFVEVILSGNNNL